MWDRLILFPPTPDYATIGLALAIGAATLLVWFVVRRWRSEPAAPLLVQGLTWLVEDHEIWGPCCDACQVRLPSLQSVFMSIACGALALIVGYEVFRRYRESFVFYV